MGIYCYRSYCIIDYAGNGEFPGYKSGVGEPGEEFKNRINRNNVIQLYQNSVQASLEKEIVLFY
jgi:hypothetical protein